MQQSPQNRGLCPWSEAFPCGKCPYHVPSSVSSADSFPTRGEAFWSRRARFQSASLTASPPGEAFWPTAENGLFTVGDRPAGFYHAIPSGFFTRLGIKQGRHFPVGNARIMSPHQSAPLTASPPGGSLLVPAGSVSVSSADSFPTGGSLLVPAGSVLFMNLLKEPYPKMNSPSRPMLTREA